MTANTYPALFTAFFANFILGASSIYWHLFEEISSITLVIYRVIFSFIVLCFAIPLLRKIGAIDKPKLSTHLIAIHTVAAVLVAINWGVFIWSSLHGSVLESGIGYLLAPVLVIVFGILFGNKKKSTIQTFCIAIIAIALIALIVSNNRLEHWVYWSIGVTWGSYTLLKRRSKTSPINGIFIETAVLLAMIPAIFTLMSPESFTPSLSFFSSHPWLLAAGLVSVVPLVMFAFAASKLSAYSMGALQFVLPSTQLAVSAFYYRQEIPNATYMCFAVIWLALVLTTFWEPLKAGLHRDT
ncbi:EamA family transporter [Comamonas testosteroni]|uniref:EamA family transporter n=1 Tax=Comamonas testosteroni TaxID=285 RepID=UPI0011471B08|nr:EamA family transporter [Comamonas testosteroni]